MDVCKGTRRIKMPHQVVMKAPGLLPMLYKIKELSEELDVPERTLRHWLEVGVPHQRDARHHVWVNGVELAQWISMQARPKRITQRLSKNEAYCLRCKRVVQLQDPKTIPIKGLLVHIRGTCEHCGCTICRGGRSDQSK